MREINVFRRGKLLKVIIRAPRMGEKGLEVTYKGRTYLLFNGDSIETAGMVTPSPASTYHGTIQVPASSSGSVAPDRRRDLPNDEDWHDAQRSVIEASPAARLIVEAAPGTGKTAVACARIAFLLREGVPADKIWLISFTRTAVQEIRNRVRSLARNDDEVSAVRIATIDSTAWQLRQGFEAESDALKAGFAEGIEATIRMLRDGGTDLNEAVGEIEHLIIDEAQDVVRERADLVIELLHRLERGCGVTILCDSAQAIYGFGDEAADPLDPDADTLVYRLRRETRWGFTIRELSEVIRTDDTALRSLFVNTRRIVLSADATFADVRKSIEASAHGRVGDKLEANGIAGRAEVLALFRRRSEVLTSGSFLASGGHPFRLRLSAFPLRLAPWLAVVFGEWQLPQISRTQFLERIAATVGEATNGPSANDRWSLLVRHAGITHDVVDLRRLREKLARPQPPIEFTTAEIGDRGPMLSTIHASKGREADEVHLMLDSASASQSSKEEQRVIFVGATRARRRLLVGRAVGSRSKDLASGRKYSIKNGWRAQVEVGREGDLLEASLVSRAALASVESVRQNQAWIALLGGAPVRCTAWKVKENGSYEWRLQREADGEYVGLLSRRFDYELFEIRNRLASGRLLGTPGMVPYVFALCARTVVRPMGHSDVDGAHEPWASSGFWLAPVIFAYSTVDFTAAHKETI